MFLEVEQVDQLLVKLDKVRKEGKRANPEEFWEPPRQPLVHKRAKPHGDTGKLSNEAKEQRERESMR
jgi:hypothetical protein